MTQVIPFPALATFHPCIFHSVAPSITEAGAIVANGAETFSGKEMRTFMNGPGRFSPD